MVERSTWTDERMDDFVASINARFDQVDARFAHVESRLDRIELRLDRMSDHLLAMQRQIAVGAWAVVAVLLTQLVAFLVASS